jgi:hypothetical protein
MLAHWIGPGGNEPVATDNLLDLDRGIWHNLVESFCFSVVDRIAQLS